MIAPGLASTPHRPGRGQLALVLTPEAGTHAYGPYPRRADGRFDWHEARRIVEQERQGQAQCRRVDEPDPWSAERIA